MLASSTVANLLASNHAAVPVYGNDGLIHAAVPINLGLLSYGTDDTCTNSDIAGYTCGGTTTSGTTSGTISSGTTSGTTSGSTSGTLSKLTSGTTSGTTTTTGSGSTTTSTGGTVTYGTNDTCTNSDIAGYTCGGSTTSGTTSGTTTTTTSNVDVTSLTQVGPSDTYNGITYTSYSNGMVVPSTLKWCTKNGLFDGTPLTNTETFIVSDQTITTTSEGIVCMPPPSLSLLDLNRFPGMSPKNVLAHVEQRLLI